MSVSSIPERAGRRHFALQRRTTSRFRLVFGERMGGDATVALKAGHHEAGIGALVAVFETGDDPAFPVPGVGTADEVREEALFVSCGMEGGLGHHRRRQGGKPDIAGQTGDGADIMALAPRHHAPATKPAVGPHHDPNPGPGLAQTLDRTLRNSPRMERPIGLRWAKAGDRKMVAREYMERQKAIAVVAAVKETAFLVAVHRIIGGIEIRRQFLRRHLVAGDEGLDEDLVKSPRRLSAGAVLEPAQARRAALVFETGGHGEL